MVFILSFIFLILFTAHNDLNAMRQRGIQAIVRPTCLVTPLHHASNHLIRTLHKTQQIQQLCSNIAISEHQQKLLDEIYQEIDTEISKNCVVSFDAGTLKDKDRLNKMVRTKLENETKKFHTKLDKDLLHKIIHLKLENKAEKERKALGATFLWIPAAILCFSAGCFSDFLPELNYMYFGVGGITALLAAGCLKSTKRELKDIEVLKKKYPLLFTDKERSIK